MVHLVLTHHFQLQVAPLILALVQLARELGQLLPQLALRRPLAIQLPVQHLQLLIHLPYRRLPHILPLQLHLRRLLELALLTRLELQALQGTAAVSQRLVLILDALHLQLALIQLAFQLHQLPAHLRYLTVCRLQLALVLQLQCLLHLLSA